MKKLIFLAVLVALVAIIYTLTMGYGLPDNALRRTMQPEFEERRAQWDAANITHYRITAYSRNPYSACSGAVLEVRRGAVNRIEGMADDTEFPGLDINCTDMPEFQRQYEDFTIEDAFATAQQYLYETTGIETTITVDIEYDEQYGFPVMINVYSPSISHMPYILIKDFEPLPN